MRLATKIVCVYVLALLGITLVFALLIAENERQLVIAIHEKEAAELVNSMRNDLLEAERRGDPEERQRVLRQYSRQQSRKVGVKWIDPESGQRASNGMITKQEIITITVPDPEKGELHKTYVPLDAGPTLKANSPAGPTGLKTGSSKSGVGVEVTTQDEMARDRFPRALRRSLLALAAVMIVSVVAFFLGAVRLLGRPLKKLIEKVNRVSEGDLKGPVLIRSRDELGKLGDSINQMCDRLQKQRERIEAETAARVATESQLRHADRLTTVGRLAAGVAHEMGTPLGVVSGRAELIATGNLSNEAIQDSASIIKQESERISSIIRNLLDFARRGGANRTDINVVDVLKHTVELLSPLAHKRDVQIRLHCDTDVIDAHLDGGQIQQVVSNLVSNGIAAVDQGGQIDLFIEQVRENDRDYIELVVKDDGPGIERDQIEKIFEPFFTTKEVGEGTGLGLSIAHGIVEDHGGVIQVQSQPGEGTTFTILMPISDEQNPRTEIPTSESNDLVSQEPLVAQKVTSLST